MEITENLINEFQHLGYAVNLDGENIKLKYELHNKPDRSRITPLLDVLKEHKVDVIGYLKNTQTSQVEPSDEPSQTKADDRQDSPPQETRSEDTTVARPASDNHDPATPLPEDNFEPSSADRNPGSPRMPYIDSHGVLIIPFDSDPKYHYWSGGQSLIQTLQELNASQEVIEKYRSIYSN